MPPKWLNGLAYSSQILVFQNWSVQCLLFTIYIKILNLYVKIKQRQIIIEPFEPYSSQILVFQNSRHLL